MLIANPAEFASGCSGIVLSRNGPGVRRPVSRAGRARAKRLRGSPGDRARGQGDPGREPAEGGGPGGGEGGAAFQFRAHDTACGREALAPGRRR